MRDFEFSDIDEILHVAAARTTNKAVQANVRAARIELRSHRPLAAWKLSDKALDAVRKACEEEPSEPIRACLTDVFACFKGDAAVNVVVAKWKTPYSELPPPDEFVELAAFRPGRVLDKASEKRFLEHLESGTPLEIVLRGHLWIESALMRYLAEYVPRPEHLDKARLSFAQRLYLIVALGLVPADELPALIVLNKLRNQVAHRLDAAIGEEEEEALIDSLGPGTRFASGVDREENKNQPFPHRLQHAIAALLLMIDAHHETLIASRKRDHYIHEQVIRVLDESRRTAASSSK